MTTTTAARPTLGEPTTWHFPRFEEATLARDLRLLYRHLPGQGVVSVGVLADAPVTAEPRELAGLATITAWALDEGSEERDADAFAAALDRCGATLHPSAAITGLTVTLDVPGGHLADGLDLLAEALRAPAFPGREVDRLVRQRIDQIAQQHARPESRAEIAARAALIAADHRAAVPSGGTAETVERIDRDAVAAFHADQVLTGPLTIVVAGDLEGVDLPALIATRFGDWAEAARPRAEAVPLAHRAGPRIVLVDKPAAVQTQVVAGRPGPDRHAPDWPAARVAAYVLGGTLTSRLDAVLREEKGYTYGIRSRLRTFRSGGVAQLVAGSVHTEATADALADALAIIRGLAADGVTEAERDDAVAYLAGVQPLQFETAHAVVSRVLRDVADDLPADHTDRELADLRAVGVDAVSAAAAAHLHADDLTLVIVGDGEAVGDALRDLDHGEVEVV